MNQTLQILLFIIVINIIPKPLSAQERFRIMFYNVENLFDVKDNPDTLDNEFLHSGIRRWTNKRYYQKLQQTAKVIIAAGEWDQPALVGLCEVENDSVLYRLTHHTPLKKLNYKYVITTGSDPRGIQVALLYAPDQFSYEGHSSVPIPFSDKKRRSRDLLHVWGQLADGSRLDVMVCHFPSRYGGEKETEKARMEAAKKVCQTKDSLYKADISLQFLVLGDFNDTPENQSITKGLNVFPASLTTPITSDKLYATFSGNNNQKLIPGSHKHQGHWSQLDQLIVSGSLLTNEKGFLLLKESVQVFSPSFLLTSDHSYGGVRPFRTYYGYKYEGGFSDHLPIVADFLFLK